MTIWYRKLEFLIKIKEDKERARCRCYSSKQYLRAEKNSTKNINWLCVVYLLVNIKLSMSHLST